MIERTELLAWVASMYYEDDLTQDQADRIFQNIEENIDRIVNSEAGPCVPGGPRHGPARSGGPRFGEPDSAEEAEVTA